MGIKSKGAPVIYALAVLQTSNLQVRSGRGFELTEAGQLMALKVYDADKWLMTANPSK
jgi:hypothetical protein